MLITVGGGAVPSNFTTPLTEDPSAGLAGVPAIISFSAIKLSKDVQATATAKYDRL